MVYTLDNIEKVADEISWSDREKIDELLRVDAELYCNLGIDSTIKERAEVKKMSRRIYREIKKIDKALGETFLNNLR